MEAVATVIASALISTGIAATIMKFFVESALRRTQEKHKVEQQRREERYKLDDEWQHNVGRVLFWVHHGIRRHEKIEAKEYWNGELAKAMENMEIIEKKKKDLDREQLAEANE